MIGYQFGVVELIRTSEESQVHLGPNLLGRDWDSAETVQRLSAEPDCPIGVALLDQRNLAGSAMSTWPKCSSCAASILGSPRGGARQEAIKAATVVIPSPAPIAAQHMRRRWGEASRNRQASDCTVTLAEENRAVIRLTNRQPEPPDANRRDFGSFRSGQSLPQPSTPSS